MLAFIKGYLVFSSICTIIFLLLIKFDCEEYPSNDIRGWD